METSKNLIADTSKGTEIIRKSYPVLTALLLLFMLNGCSTISAVAQRVDLQVGIDLPSWAPYYDNAELVRY